MIRLTTEANGFFFSVMALFPMQWSLLLVLRLTLVDYVKCINYFVTSSVMFGSNRDPFIGTDFSVYIYIYTHTYNMLINSMNKTSKPLSWSENVDVLLFAYWFIKRSNLLDYYLWVRTLY